MHTALYNGSNSSTSFLNFLLYDCRFGLQADIYSLSVLIIQSKQ